MKYLLDTHALIWFLTGETHRFSPAMLEILQNDAETLYFSAASIWEIAIKSTLGKADFRISAQTIHNELLAQDFLPLPIEAQHAIHTAHLPPFITTPSTACCLPRQSKKTSSCSPPTKSCANTANPGYSL